MADQQYKGVSLLGKSPLFPAIGGLAPNSLCRWSPFGALHRAQDSILAGGRRVVAEWSISGAAAFAQPSGTADPGDPVPVGAQVYPLSSLWRRIGTYRASVTPGCELRARVVYAPAGLTQKQVGPNWQSDGAWGALRIGHTWAQSPTGSSTTIAYRSISMEGSPLGTWKGGEPTASGGGWWSMLRHRDIVDIRPDGFLTTPATAEDYSEWAQVQLQIDVKGGARVVHVVIYEHPISHVQAHDNASLKSAHAAPAGNAPMTLVPQTKPPNGVTYQENRHGTTQTMQVAERQSERLGPHVLSVSSWRESDASIWSQTEGNPFTTTSTSFGEITGSGATTWAAESRGWIVAGAHAKLHRLCEPGLIMRGGVAGVIPVRVWVDASQSAGTGTVRVQSSPYEWVDVPITGARDWYSVPGYLLSQTYGDEHVANVQIFVRCTTGTLSTYNIAVDFGSWAVQI